jgi:hypothetical protein
MTFSFSRDGIETDILSLRGNVKDATWEVIRLIHPESGLALFRCYGALSPLVAGLVL